MLSIAFVLAAAFSCQPVPKRNPTSVRDLGAGDVDVMLALGDSITAGFGIMGRAGLLNEYRGLSWSIGADKNATTLPNYVKRYNPNVVGGSVGSHLMTLCYDYLCPSRHYPKTDILNGAESGAYVMNMADSQVDYLVSEMQTMGIDVKNSWKHLTIMIGANDLCMTCIGRSLLSADEFEENLRKAMQEIRDQIPRVVVSYVEMFNITQIYELAQRSTFCSDLHSLFFVECTCAFGPIDGAATRKGMDEAVSRYNERARKVIKEFNENGGDTFAAVIQPMMRNLRADEQPLDFLSTIDCFHPSLLAHETMATNLWNQLWQPVGKKLENLQPNPKVYCPTSSDRIQL